MTQNFLDSSAVFTETALKYGLPPQCLALMREKGWDTYAGLAFSTAFAPDDKAEGDFFAAEVQSVLVSAQVIEDSQLPVLRRLWKEAQVYWTTHMKRKAEQDDKPSRLAPAELNERLERIRKKLGGLHWGSSLEPSHALVNKFCQMYEDNITPWEQLTSRSHEAAGLIKDVGTRLIITDSSGSLRFRTVDNEPQIPLGSDLKIEQALLRRGIAMDMVGLLSFEVHNLLVARFTDDI
eukprot:6481499-Amphidinium_carterae.2